MEIIAQIIGQLILLSAVIIVGFVQNGTIKAQEKELKSIRTFMEIFDVAKVKEYVELTTESKDKKAREAEKDLREVEKKLTATIKALGETTELTKEGIKMTKTQFLHIYGVTRTIVNHFEEELKVAQLEWGKEKKEQLDKLIDKIKVMLPPLRQIRDTSKSGRLNKK